MSGTRGTVIITLCAVGLLIAAVTLVLPWWTVEASGGGTSTEVSVKPFDQGQAGEDLSNGDGVVAVGVLTLFGVVATAGGFALLLRARQTGEPAADPAPWLVLAGGALYIIAAIVAVFTWPAGDIGFWDSADGGGGAFAAAAGVGWYLSIVAGAVLSGAGITSLQTPETS